MSQLLKQELYEEIKSMICPYCRVKIPDVMYSTTTDPMWEHCIPETEHKFMCQAAKFRNAFAQRTIK